MGYGNFRGSSGGGFRRGGGGFRSGGGFRRDFNREMTKIKCAECGKEDEVPFKPREGTPVYCKDCYFKKKGLSPRSGPSESKPKEESESSEDSESFGEDEPKSSEEEF